MSDIILGELLSIRPDEYISIANDLEGCLPVHYNCHIIIALSCLRPRLQEREMIFTKCTKYSFATCSTFSLLRVLDHVLRTTEIPTGNTKDALWKNAYMQTCQKCKGGNTIGLKYLPSCYDNLFLHV